MEMVEVIIDAYNFIIIIMGFVANLINAGQSEISCIAYTCLHCLRAHTQYDYIVTMTIIKVIHSQYYYSCHAVG